MWIQDLQFLDTGESMFLDTGESMFLDTAESMFLGAGESMFLDTGESMFLVFIYFLFSFFNILTRYTFVLRNIEQITIRRAFICLVFYET